MFLRRPCMHVALTVLVVAIFSLAASPARGTTVIVPDNQIFFAVTSPLSSGPPFPASDSILGTLYPGGPVIPPSPIRNFALNLVNFFPGGPVLPPSPTRLQGADNGVGGAPGSAAMFDLFWIPGNPVVPPSLTGMVQFDFTRGSGDPAQIQPVGLVGLPAVQFNDSTFDVAFQLDSGGAGQEMYMLQGVVADAEAWRFTDVSATVGSLDLSFTLEPIGVQTISGDTQLVGLTLTGQLNPVPEPLTMLGVVLGLGGLGRYVRRRLAVVKD